jgi:hypothetical protein
MRSTSGCKPIVRTRGNAVGLPDERAVASRLAAPRRVFPFVTKSSTSVMRSPTRGNSATSMVSK